VVSGKAAVIASGKPFSPSKTAIRISWMYEEGQETIRGGLLKNAAFADSIAR
jgi:hypothetical protein